MANRYWVGGTATWDATAGTKWSTTSGGGGGAAVPTSADDVFFDANSGANTITLGASGNCRNFDCTGFTGTFAGTSQLSIAGNMKLVSGMTLTYSGAILFTSTATGQTVECGTKTLLSNVSFTGSGGGWTLQDDMNATGKTITLTRGTLDLNGKTVTCSTLNSSNTNTRTLTMGAATVNLAFWTLTNSANLTLSANTSTINVTQGLFAGGSLNYNIVTLTGGNLVSGNNTFATLTATANAVKSNGCMFSGNQTISGTLTLNGNSKVNRLHVHSNVPMVPRTLTAATVVSNGADFEDITGAGAGDWDLSGASNYTGNCGGNSNITFTTAAPQYWFKNSGNWSDATKWFLATNGGGGAGRVPLPQDDVYFDANSFDTGAQTIAWDMPRMGSNISFAGVTNNPSTVTTISNTFYGSLTVDGANVTSDNPSLEAGGHGNYDLTATNFALFDLRVFVGNGNKLILMSNLTLDPTGYLQVYEGEFDMNDFNVDCGAYDDTGTSAGGGATFRMGSGTITIREANTVWFHSGTVNIIPETSTIKMVNTTNTNISFGGFGDGTYNKIWFSRGTSTGSITITGNNTIGELKDDGSVAHSLIFTAGTTQHITTWSVTGASGAVITINSSTTATHNLIKDGGGVVSTDYLNIQHSVATPTTSWYAGTHSVDNQATPTAGSGWIFTSPPGITKVEVKVSGAWKIASGMQINIGDSWKTVSGAQINIGDTWKTIF